LSSRPLSFSSLRTVPISERKADTDERDYGAPYVAVIDALGDDVD